MSNGRGIGNRLREFGGIIAQWMGSNRRDLYKVFNYTDLPTYDNMFFKYNRQDLAKRVVDAEPNTTWASPPEIEASEEFVTAWEALVKKHNLYSRIMTMDKLLGLGRFSVLVIGIDDGQALDKPVASDNNNVIYLKAYGEHRVSITKYYEDPTKPEYGQPEVYNIKPGLTKETVMNARGQSTSFNPNPFDVHASRVIHAAESITDNDLFGIPRMLPIYNLLDDILKVAGAASETFWLMANRGMQIDIDKDMNLSAADTEALGAEVGEYEDNQSRIIKTRGVTITPLGSDVADPKNTFDVLLSLLSGATGIPRRILIGSEVAQLASAQDRANWATHIERRRVLFAEPQILNPLIRKLTALGILPEAEDIEFKWPDAFIQNPLEKAETAAQTARSLANVSKALSADVSVISVEEGREILCIEGPPPPQKQLPPPADNGGEDTTGDENGGNGGGSNGNNN